MRLDRAEQLDRELGLGRSGPARSRNATGCATAVTTRPPGTRRRPCRRDRRSRPRARPARRAARSPRWRRRRCIHRLPAARAMPVAGGERLERLVLRPAGEPARHRRRRQVGRRPRLAAPARGPARRAARPGRRRPRSCARPPPCSTRGRAADRLPDSSASSSWRVRLDVAQLGVAHACTARCRRSARPDRSGRPTAGCSRWRVSSASCRARSNSPRTHAPYARIPVSNGASGWSSAPGAWQAASAQAKTS